MCLFGNGRYSVMLTDAGAGYSHWRDQAITRWREDPTCDDWGSFVLLRDLCSGAQWSPARQPLGVDNQVQGGAFGHGQVAFTGERDGLTATLAVAVADDCDAEVRRITLHNRSGSAREIELTSYAELVLGSASADASHPAFAKLFVQTYWDADGEVLLATRRKRSPDDADLWAGHRIVVPGSLSMEDAAIQYETDRARFLGRGNRLPDAVALQLGSVLSNTVGTVLDPVFSLRTRVRIAAGATGRIDFWTLAATSREQLVGVAADLTPTSAGACFARPRATAVADADARQPPSIDDGDADPWNRWLAPLLYADPGWRAAPDALRRGAGGAPVLWRHGISGDRPIVLLRIADADGIEVAAALLRAQHRWRRHWLGVDVVLLVTASGDAGAALHGQLCSLQETQAANGNDGEVAKAEVFALRQDQVDGAFIDGLTRAARVVLVGDGTEAIPPAARQPADGIGQPGTPETPTPGTQTIDAADDAAAAAPWPGATEGALEFDNGLGGFADDGREYRIELEHGACTPAPWINVVANPGFGFIASAEGGGYTWSRNSQQNPLTPWPNDPVTDAPNEVLYLRDEHSGDLWSATAAPIRAEGVRYRVTHGKGWSRYSHHAHGIDVDLLQYVPMADSIKLSRLRLHNRSGRARQLSVTGYVRWALAPNGSNAAPYVVTDLDEATGALFARNTWRAEFGERVAFIDLGGAQSSCSGDRSAFLGRYGAIDKPQALSAASLPGRTGAGLDPCGALQTHVTLAADEPVELQFVLGDADSAQAAQELVRRYRDADPDEVLGQVRKHWDGVLDTVQVKTPDRALDILINDWLLYQSLGCRVWARSAYYQSSGAYGFRDQLQDVMSLCVACPALAREHIVRSAGRQFPEGDVQHWWLPPQGQGIRTRMSDDRLWLPYVAAHYVRTTGDGTVLEDNVPFLAGQALKPGQDEAFFKPRVGDQAASVYEHGARAIDVSLGLGPHGLPLIGTGDWNDGMNGVGEKGRGESVWLVWLLVATIDAYTRFAEACGDDARVARWREHAALLRKTVETAGWDGDWYRRGYYDDGTPLGSAQSQECRIDAIAQSWSAMAGASDRSHV
ncbi:MAG: glycosyl transferase family 36, partial [Casimicrobiaceae bacterium]